MKKLNFIDCDCPLKLWFSAGVSDISTEQQYLQILQVT